MPLEVKGKLILCPPRGDGEKPNATTSIACRSIEKQSPICYINETEMWSRSLCDEIG